MHAFGDRRNPVLVLLHGIGAGHRLWLRQIEEFRGSHFVLVPDIPGLTASLETAKVSIPEIAHRLETELHDQAIDRFSVCGISAGASVALALALRMGAKIQNLVLSAPQAHAPRIALGLQIAVCRLMPEQMLVTATKAMLKRDPEIAQAAAEDCEAMGKQGLLKAMAALYSLDLRADLPKIEAQTTIFCGANDRVNIPAARAVAAAIPGANLFIEADMGHLWNVQSPARFNDALTRVLSG